MQVTDIEGGLSLSSAEGWNQTQKDWRLLIETPGNISMLVEHANKIVGTTTAINYTNKVAWIGMVLVNKEYRSRGLSKLLLNDILNKLETCESVKLDATPSGQQVYKNFGFKDEYLIARMVNMSMKSLLPVESDVAPVHFTQNDIDEIIALDELNFGANRVKLIESLLTKFPGKAWLMRRNKMVVGFVLGREGARYHHIGPLIATSTLDAKNLISSALKKLTKLPVVVDVICDKEDFINWLNEIGFTKQRDFVRMYKDTNPYPGITKSQFLICGPEFG